MPNQDGNVLSEKYKKYAEKLVSIIMRNFSVSEDLRQELTSAAYLALVESAHRFDPDKSSNFVAFASLRIRGAVYDQLSHSTWYRSNRSKKILNLARAKDDSSNAETSFPDSLGGVLSQVADQAIGYSLMFGDCDPDSLEFSEADPELLTEALQQSARIALAVSQLEERCRFVIKKIYFEDLSFEEVASQFGEQSFWKHGGYPSKGWISKLHRKALDELKRRLAEFE
jgi:RNA polymerase sigma factor (sigma-70 family)